ncbi:MAG TPA: hypothetical protein VER11_27880 [Polyangiaceae bacterium]|nr:hypothetical protein [Polyangiaceae bacterium]
MPALRPTHGRRCQERAPWALKLTRGAALLSALTLLLAAHAAHAASEPKERAISTDEVVSWLDSNSDPAALAGDQGASEEQLVPRPPPRHHGFVVESGIGALGQIGDMKHTSPVAPWFHLQVGYEPLRFLMVFVEGDLVLSNTSYAPPPPPQRTYALWGFGAGLRGTVKASDRVGLYLQGSLGGAQVTNDVLSIYGYEDADKLNLYVAAELGVEWYQISPHWALAVHGGVRDYIGTFKREFSDQPPLAWVSGLGLRYTF